MTTSRLRIALALFLGALFLLAQAHFCVDAGRPGTSAHACQNCASGAWAMASPQLDMGPAVEARPLEAITPAPIVDPDFARTRSPRAPPAA